MTRHLIMSLVAGLLGFAVLAAADDPTADEPPVRLKKKSRPPADAAKEDPPPDKAGEPKDRPPEPRPMPEEKRRPDDPPEPDVDEQELLNRVSRNMRTSEDRLANRELGEGTRQVQRDIVDDLDKLIKKMEQPPPDSNGGGSGSPSASSGGQKQRGQQANSGGRRSSSRQSARGPGQNPAGQSQMQGGPGSQSQNNTAGGNPGAGTDRPEDRNRPTADKFDVWGHLPETLRAEMNAYSRQEYMAKYADIIKQYYSTVAEKGRKKGD